VLRVERRGAERLGADAARRLRGVDVRVLEEAEGELLREDAHHGAVEPRLRQLARAHGLDERLGVLRPPELVDPGLHGLHEAHAHRQPLDAPGHRHVGERRALAGRHAVAAARGAVVGDPPVGEDHAAEAVATAQHVSEELAAESRPDGLDRAPLPRGALENRVGGHHAGDVRFKRAEEGAHVVGEVLPREGGEAAVEVVAVVAVLRRAVAHPVLHDRRDADAVHARGAVLEALDVGAHEAAREVGVLAEGAVDAAPARLGGEVGLRGEGLVDADGAVLLPGDVAEPPDERRVA
jgi:hypothetical protein